MSVLVFYVQACICVCVCERERKRDRERDRESVYCHTLHDFLVNGLNKSVSFFFTDFSVPDFDHFVSLSCFSTSLCLSLCLSLPPSLSLSLIPHILQKPFHDCTYICILKILFNPSIFIRTFCIVHTYQCLPQKLFTFRAFSHWEWAVERKWWCTGSTGLELEAQFSLDELLEDKIFMRSR